MGRFSTDPTLAVVSRVMAGLTGWPIEEITAETPLFEGGLEIDSIGFLEGILALESHLDVRLRSEDLDEDALATVGSLTDHIRQRLG